VFSLRLELCQICDSKQFFLEHDRMGTLNSKNGKTNGGDKSVFLISIVTFLFTVAVII